MELKTYDQTGMIMGRSLSSNNTLYNKTQKSLTSIVTKSVQILIPVNIKT
jgi:hypothetical protein